MKPHIYKHQSLWYCKHKYITGFLIGFFVTKISGIGYTPKDAYKDWRLQTFGV